MNDQRFGHMSYTIRKKFATLAGAKFHVFDASGRLVFFTKQKAFRLKEDIRLYDDESMDRVVLSLRARKVIDFGVTFDVVDEENNAVVGSLRRKGMKSIVKDEWLVFGPENEQLAMIKEDGTALAVLRRLHEFFCLLAPQAHHVEVDGMPIARFVQNRNPFIHKVEVSITGDADNTLDPRLTVASAILIAAIEGRQG